MNEQQRAELERIRDVLYPATGLEDYDEELIGRVLKDINTLLAQDALYKMAEDAVTIGLSYNDWPKIGCVNHDCDKCRGVQEPFMWVCNSLDETEWETSKHKECEHCIPLYTAPQPAPVKTYHDGKPWPVQPKPWVGLTDEEIDAAWPSPKGTNSVRTLVHIIETKLKEKNHDQ
jgi:hypothetical protein